MIVDEKLNSVDAPTTPSLGESGPRGTYDMFCLGFVGIRRAADDLLYACPAELLEPASGGTSLNIAADTLSAFSEGPGVISACEMTLTAVDFRGRLARFRGECLPRGAEIEVEESSITDPSKPFLFFRRGIVTDVAGRFNLMDSFSDAAFLSTVASVFVFGGDF